MSSERTLLLAVRLGLAAPICAQTPVAAPASWTAQTRNAGARAFTPPNFQKGEICLFEQLVGVPASDMKTEDRL